MFFLLRSNQEIDALSQRIIIENIASSGPPEMVRILTEAAIGNFLTKSGLNTGKVGTTYVATGVKRKYNSVAGSEVKSAVESHVLPPSSEEQVEEARRKNEELQKNLALLRKRLEEKQKRKMQQKTSNHYDTASEDGEIALSLDLPFTRDPTAVPSDSLVESDHLGRTEGGAENSIDGAKELEYSNGVSEVSIETLRMRQKQLRQTIELSNLKNFASQQKSLLSKQKSKLKESRQLWQECEVEVNMYESIVQDGEKRLTDLERRQKLLLGMLAKATRNVLDARRNLNEAKLAVSEGSEPSASR